MEAYLFNDVISLVCLLFGDSISIPFISCGVKTPDRSIKGGWVSSGSQFKRCCPWGQHCVKSLRRCGKLQLQSGSRESICWCSVLLLFSVRPRTPAMESYTFKLDLLTSISPVLSSHVLMFPLGGSRSCQSDNQH